MVETWKISIIQNETGRCVYETIPQGATLLVNTLRGAVEQLKRGCRKVGEGLSKGSLHTAVGAAPPNSRGETRGNVVYCSPFPFKVS